MQSSYCSKFTAAPFRGAFRFISHHQSELGNDCLSVMNLLWAKRRSWCISSVWLWSFCCCCQEAADEPEEQPKTCPLLLCFHKEILFWWRCCNRRTHKPPWIWKPWIFIVICFPYTVCTYLKMFHTSLNHKLWGCYFCFVFILALWFKCGKRVWNCGEYFVKLSDYHRSLYITVMGTLGDVWRLHSLVLCRLRGNVPHLWQILFYQTEIFTPQLCPPSRSLTPPSPLSTEMYSHTVTEGII